MTFPLGPYHPTLTEPIALQLALRGEHVTGVESHTGYLRRGVEELVCQRDLEGALDAIEHVCGTCGYGYRLALCIALEELAGVTPPPRVVAWRTIFAEIERMLARLWFMQQVGRVGEFGALLTSAVETREILFEACAQATGKRLFWGLPIPGGMKELDDPEALNEILDDLAARLLEITRIVAPQGLVGRSTAQLGTISEDMATNLGLTGLALRAIGVDDDLRVTDPYLAYGDHAELLDWEPKGYTGDCASRLRLATVDLVVSLAFVRTLLADLPTGQEREAFPALLPSGERTVAIEGARGRASVNLRVGGSGAIDTSAPGWLTAFALHTPGDVNAGAIPIVLNGKQLGDVPLILASLDLCIACLDK